ncbi:multidrug effflux MFS transporter [Pseudoxanthomonas sp. SL93]|jgi:DHA1 family bicyclomycin/chloramphenicol resistance-like MFS transporter|uniref:multidrug effflux MFS transporter n=1 Tax=Pseudoxanthomonas sp. SL93 TaxID=2995142 RepID=UPI00226F1E1B|nr:multidrug effflux MFS transporter [Pseudoxanthomonas sp. SL93]WAC64597.1 multidrug effflux MFS transporter [Pseudoxanthomonas sp. SL93]
MSVAKPVSSLRLALLLGGLAMFGPFSIDTIFPAFPAMGAQLGADKVAMQQTISVYLLTYALMSLVHGPLSDAFGRRKVILGGLSVFLLASVGCALSTDMGTLLFFRALQGLSAGVGFIVGRAVVRDVHHGDDAQRLMSQVSMIFGIAPAIAPIVGGWILGWSAWPMIFWFLAGFSLLLMLSVGAWLPETHPKEVRLKVSPRHLLRDYFAILGNRRFLRLAAAGSLSFGGLFLYIASAPAFVMDLLHLNEQQFAWLFLPTIGGMVLGAFLSGRSAGRVEGRRLVAIGFGCMAVAMVANVGYNAWAGDAMRIPWAVMPMTLAALGVALVFPILTLSILDMYPRQRGAASSLQAFSNLVVNAIIAGVLSPLLSHHGLHLALGMAGFTLLGWLMWRWEASVSRDMPSCPRESAALEPTDHL